MGVSSKPDLDERSLDRAVAKSDERMILSEPDSLRVLDLLRRPPEPTAALLRAARAEQSEA
jgi:uncharacterized protein (DUF1778 family)